MRLPGMVLAGLTPNWTLIWVVCWSVNRPTGQAALAGLMLGFLQDAISQPRPTHALGLAIVGILTARLQKQRVLKEDFISAALIVFGMVAIAETLMALQWTLLLGWNEDSGQWAARTIDSIWLNHQTIALRSAIISSLWAPAVYLPLSSWWKRFEGDRQENRSE